MDFFPFSDGSVMRTDSGLLGSFCRCLQSKIESFLWTLFLQSKIESFLWTLLDFGLLSRIKIGSYYLRPKKNTTMGYVPRKVVHV
jgi:hypothetical protein